MISSYSKIYNLGHKAVRGIFDSDVVIQEKIDGSQISFMVLNGELIIRSKNKIIDKNNPDKLFDKAVEVIQSLALREGYIYRGEYLKTPKHNCLAYDRIPHNHIILFDIDQRDQSYIDEEALFEEADRIGLESVPIFHCGKVSSEEDIKKFLETKSCLGGQKIEGIVIKNYAMFGADKKVLMAKYVSEAFKESNKKKWKQANPNRSDVLQFLIRELTTPARWNKAIQHLKEDGVLEDSPKDISLLIQEIQNDTIIEEGEYIKRTLFQWAMPKIKKGIISGFPEYYKRKLMEKQFESVNRKESEG